jgi:3-deoxy-D-manno-octulosonic-acid transferase
MFQALLYHLAVRLYAATVYIAAKFGHSRAKDRIYMVRDAHFHYANIPNKKSRRAWLHAASAGEWMQLSPLARIMNADGWDIVVSFFSPSALHFIEKKSYPYFILPFDGEKTSSEMVQLLAPDIFITSRRELWLFLLQALNKGHIPVTLLNVYIPKKIIPLKTQWWRFFSPHIDLACCADDYSTLKMREWGAGRTVITGDTKFDQSNRVIRDKALHDYLSGKKVVILGSAHAPELLWMSDFIRDYHTNFPDWYWVIVPHELHRGGFEAWQKATKLPAAHYNGQLSGNIEHVLYVDAVGILAGLYAYSRIAIVGGGWSTGTHNVIEPASQGNAIIMGPKHDTFTEAIGLVGYGGAVVASGYHDIETILLKWLSHEEDYATVGEAAKEYSQSMQGASNRCYSEIKMLLQ